MGSQLGLSLASVWALLLVEHAQELLVSLVKWWLTSPEGGSLEECCAVHMHMGGVPAVADMVCAWWALASELPVLAPGHLPPTTGSNMRWLLRKLQRWLWSDQEGVLMSKYRVCIFYVDDLSIHSMST